MRRLTDRVPGPQGLDGDAQGGHRGLTPATSAPVLQPLDQGAVLTSRSSCSRNATGRVSADKPKPFRSGPATGDAAKGVLDSREEAEISASMGVWKRLTPPRTDDFGALDAMRGEVAADGGDGGVGPGGGRSRCLQVSECLLSCNPRWRTCGPRRPR